jgi:hypothetical protein
MATKKDFNSGGVLPDGFTSPFKRVQMEERIDDAFACIATLSGRTLADVNKLAVQLGYPQSGPAWADHALITKLLHNLGFTSGEYEDVTSMAALPDVAILMVDYQPALDSGRHVVWHHVRGTKEQPAFSYVIDVASWLKPEQHITSDFRHMRMDPSWFIEVKPRANGKSK